MNQNNPEIRTDNAMREEALAASSHELLTDDRLYRLGAVAVNYGFTVIDRPQLTMVSKDEAKFLHQNPDEGIVAALKSELSDPKPEPMTLEVERISVHTDSKRRWVSLVVRDNEKTLEERARVVDILHRHDRYLELHESIMRYKPMIALAGMRRKKKIDHEAAREHLGALKPYHVRVRRIL